MSTDRTGGATATHMDANEVDEFLESHDTGVLAMAHGDDGYGIPVSYAYEAEEAAEPRLYLRLGFTPDSEKRAYVDASDRVSLTVYDETGAGWKSVVARGRLEEVTARSLDALVAEVVKELDIPYFTVHDSPTSEFHFSLVRLDVDELTGVVEGGGGAER